MPDILISNISELVYFSSDNSLQRVRDAEIYIKNGHIKAFGSKEEVSKEIDCNPDVIDAGGYLVTSGFVDCHTHIVFAGSRAHEFWRRLSGEKYIDIAKKGGGILSTVNATRNSSKGELIINARKWLDEMLRYGTMVVEAKSGYGLTTKDELKILESIRDACKDHPVKVIPTFLGAHAIPPEFKDDRYGYINMICDEMLPAVKEQGIAKFCDVFCDEGAFTVQEMEKIFIRAKELGFGLRAHLNEFENLDGVRVACELGAVSIDHLIKSTEEDVEAIKNAGCTAVLLPGTAFFLGESDYADARMFIDSGCCVAVATDFNPGSSMCDNIQAVMALSAVYLKMTPEEILRAVTVNSAYSLGLEDEFLWREGTFARINIWNVKTIEEIVYPWGGNNIRFVIVGDKIFVNK
ncbi:MAG: imidazolonepropionase [bacterium]